MLKSADVSSLVEQLRKRCSQLHVQGEPNYLTDDEIWIRYLKSRNWDLDAAEKMITRSVMWRNEIRPLNIDCEYCRSHPGAHTLRQIGFDEADRPVIYASFFPAYPSQRNCTTQVLTHMIYVMENAIRSMRVGVSHWVFIVDCTGMTPASCHPRIGYECAQVMSNHYPERLGLAICIRPGPVFKVAWQAIKQFLPATTASKVNIVSSKSQLQSSLSQCLSTSMTKWVMDEYKSNRRKPARLRYRPFWLPEPESDHDPRGETSYVDNYVKKTHQGGHLPHPTVADHFAGRLRASLTEEEEKNKEPLILDDEDDEATQMNEEEARRLIDSLPNEFQIPADAEKIR